MQPMITASASVAADVSADLAAHAKVDATALASERSEPSVLQSPDAPSGPSAPAMLAVPAVPAPHPTRRRLWQLPEDLRATLVGLGLPPERLRRCAERALQRLHRRPVALRGTEAELLASVLCDLGARNPMSEAVQAELTARHALQLARLAPCRDRDALEAAWQQALAGGEVPGTAWALLTHAQGAAFDEILRRDLRAWTLARARAAGERQCHQAQLNEALRQARAELDGLRQRLQQALAACDRARQVHAQDGARLRGEIEALRRERAAAAAAAAAPDAGAGVGPIPAAAPASPPLATAISTSSPTTPQAVTAKAVAARAATAPPTTAPAAVALATAAPPAPSPTPITWHGRRVLCVGGMPGAQDRYRRLVETAGAQFDFHDGGIEQGLHRLDRQLGAADLVVCQAGCLNHEAYRRVKGHCRRATKPCLFVERPSLAQFARALGLPRDGAEAAA